MNIDRRDLSIDGLVRAHLDRKAALVDVDRLWQRIDSQLHIKLPATLRFPTRINSSPIMLRRRLRWGVTAAAGILLLLLSTLTLGPYASAETLVANTSRALLQPIDRLYELTITPDPVLLASLPHAPTLRCQVWTRGDCFYIQVQQAEQTWCWGRDGQGRIWLTLSDRLAVRFDADEIPQILDEFIALRSADLPAILRDVLKYCDLRDVRDLPHTRTIEAKLRPSKHPFPVLEARMEIDTTRHELLSLALRRGNAAGKPLGQVTLRLLGRSPQAEQQYEAQGHLITPCEIVDRSQPLRRLQLFAKHAQRNLQWSLPARTHGRSL